MRLEKNEYNAIKAKIAPKKAKRVEKLLARPVYNGKLTGYVAPGRVCGEKVGKNARTRLWVILGGLWATYVDCSWRAIGTIRGMGLFPLP